MSKPVPPPCLRCGATPDVEWVEVTGPADPEPVFIAGRSPCPTPGCVDEHGSRNVPLDRCRFCHRPPGDIHTAECWPIVLERQLRGEAEPCRIGPHDPHIAAIPLTG